MRWLNDDHNMTVEIRPTSSTVMFCFSGFFLADQMEPGLHVERGFVYTGETANNFHKVDITFLLALAL